MLGWRVARGSGRTGAQLARGLSAPAAPAAPPKGGVLSKLFVYGGGATVATVAGVKATGALKDSKASLDLGLGPVSAADIVDAASVATPLYAAGLTVLALTRPDAMLASLPGFVRELILTVEEVRAKRPGAFLLAGGLLAVSGVWFVQGAKPYAELVMSGGLLPKSKPKPAGGDEGGIELEEVEKHNTPESTWIAIDGKVYDLTEYGPKHPGASGPDIIKKNAGTDATQGFKKAGHSPKAMGIQDGLYVGELKRNLKSELAKILNCDDMQERATQLLTAGALAYYDAGAEDLTSRKEALECWDRDWRLRPRNFIDVSNVDTGTTLLGHRLAAPIMAAPTALLKMGHEDGEAAVARGCKLAGVGNCLSTTASLSIEDVAAASPDCYRWFQLYVYKDHDKTRRLVERATKEGNSLPPARRVAATCCDLTWP